MANQYSTLTDAVEWFCGEMKRKLHDKAAGGWCGWDSSNFAQATGECGERLMNHAIAVIQGDASQALDVANFAMFIAWQRHKEEAAVLATRGKEAIDANRKTENS